MTIPAATKESGTQIAGWQVGDLADVPTLGRVQVIELRPTEIVVRVKSGDTCRLCWRILKRVR